ncbi:Crp/Fnr family transcriptional regulator [Streptomyces sp. NBC_00083]|uniref:Crp/Fnr family transcriptional regulator n=1 Tax=Streptomyces sp. NBC_00083 TaxID=2975647 RepID=UPI00224EECE8|nr:Crp/Fnr family transcriptional regulator [Streptomyces sp. NBC_00083]MCX5386262.1 Crp/Fnr family transcriptional regulator [Streptomyces sp. NBC_00083]
MSEDQSRATSPLRALVSRQVWEGLVSYPAQTFLAGRALLRQGCKGTHVLALVDGLVKVVRTDPDGRRRVLAFRGSGEVLGEMAVQCASGRLADVWAMRDCKATIIPAADFRRLMHESHLALPVAAMATHRLREQTEIYEGPVHRRLALTLLRLVEVSGGQHSFVLTREDLAQHIDVGRKAVSQALDRLGPDQVSAGKSRIDVVSVERLRETVAGRSGT